MLEKTQSRKTRPLSPERGAGRIARNRMRIAWMYYVEGLTQNEIADRLGIGRVTVVRNINEAIKQREVAALVRTRVYGLCFAGVYLLAACALVLIFGINFDVTSGNQCKQRFTAGLSQGGDPSSRVTGFSLGGPAQVCVASPYSWVVSVGVAFLTDVLLLEPGKLAVQGGAAYWAGRLCGRGKRASGAEVHPGEGGAEK